MDAFDVAQDAVSYMIVQIGAKNQIKTTSVVIEGDEKNEYLLRATHGTVAVWKG